jgi:hypothetical protein
MQLMSRVRVVDANEFGMRVTGSDCLECVAWECTKG